mgnify:CR=1 FL=1
MVDGSRGETPGAFMHNGRMSESPSVLFEQREGWVTIVLNRPHRKNAMTGPMMDLLADAIEAAGADEANAAVVLRGADGVFCSGVDLTELQASPPADWVPTFGESVRRAHLALFRCECPIVVALERYSINGSTALALAGDLGVAGDDAVMQIGEIRQGANMPMNAAWTLIKSDESTLARLALVGDRVPALRMAELGLVHEVVGAGDVIATAEAHAGRLASYPPGSARRVKAEIRRRLTIDPDTWFSSVPNDALLTADQVRS